MQGYGIRKATKESNRNLSSNFSLYPSSVFLIVEAQTKEPKLYRLVLYLHSEEDYTRLLYMSIEERH